MEKIELKGNELLYPGDLIELHYRTIGPTFLQAAHVALIEKKINAGPRFVWTSQEYKDNNRIIFRVRVVEPKPAEPQLQQAGIVSAAVALSVLTALIGGVIWLTRDAVYKIVESPAGKIGVAGLGTMGIAAGVTALWALLRGDK